jgi:hypothetical protein
LADELGDVWDEDEEAAEDADYFDEAELPQDQISGAGGAFDGNLPPDAGAGPAASAVRDSGVAMQASPLSKANLSPAAASRTAARRHQRQRSLYDGSDYGGDSDLDESGDVSVGLQRQMAAVEGLVRRGLEENGSASDQVVKRVVEQLRDLGSQTSIESAATRCVETLFHVVLMS